jgi:hypothetical protein
VVCLLVCSFCGALAALGQALASCLGALKSTVCMAYTAWQEASHRLVYGRQLRQAVALMCTCDITLSVTACTWRVT